MEPTAVIAGSVIFTIGAIFAFGIAITSGRIDYAREEHAGPQQ